MIYRMMKNREIAKTEYILWAVVSWFAVVLRSTGIYIFVVFSLILYLNLDKYKKRPFVISCFCVVLFWCFYAWPFYQLLGVQPGNKREMLSIPVQQLARAYNRGGDIRPDEKETLFEILPKERLEQFYEPRLSDPMKGSLACCMRERRREESVTLLFMLLIVLACFVGPIALVRYCLILFYGLPVMLTLPVEAFYAKL